MRFATRVDADTPAPAPLEAPDGILAELHTYFRRRERLLLRDSRAIVAIATEEIDWIEASGRELVVHAGTHAYRARASLGALLDVLDPRQFIRVHRGTIVNLDRVRELRAETHGDFTIVMSDRTVLHGSRSYRAGIAAFCAGRTGAIPIGWPRRSESR